MGHPIQAHNMLYEKDMKLAEHLVLDLESLNTARKSEVKDVLEEIDFDHSVYKEEVIVVGNEGWTPGILGLIAQKIIEETSKPTFVWGQGEDENILKGSCRSLGDVHVVDLIEAHIIALKNLPDHKHEIINLGSGDGYSVKQVISAAEKAVGHKIPSVASGRRSGDPAVLIADISKARKYLNWQPTREINQMVLDTWKSMQ